MQTKPRYIVLGPPAKDAACFIVYDQKLSCSMPEGGPAVEYFTYESAQQVADGLEKMKNF